MLKIFECEDLKPVEGALYGECKSNYRDIQSA